MEEPKPALAKHLRNRIKKGIGNNLIQDVDKDELIVEDIDDYTIKEAFRDVFHGCKAKTEELMKKNGSSVSRPTAAGEVAKRLKLKE